MRKILWIIAVLFVAISAPNAVADPIDPCISKATPGKTFVLGTPDQHLTNSATLGQLCSYPGTLTFKVSGDAIRSDGVHRRCYGPGQLPRRRSCP